MCFRISTSSIRREKSQATPTERGGEGRGREGRGGERGEEREGRGEEGRGGEERGGEEKRGDFFPRCLPRPSGTSNKAFIIHFLQCFGLRDHPPPPKTAGTIILRVSSVVTHAHLEKMNESQSW